MKNYSNFYMIMNKKLLFLPLLLWAVMAMGQSLVPAMIVHGTNGNRQVVPLEATNVTELVVLPSRQALTVDVPEATKSGIRSITFAMVDPDELQAIEQTEDTLVQRVEKVLRDGQIFIRLLLPDGTSIEYDIKGNKFN